MLDEKSKFKWFYYLNSKWVRKQRRQPTTSTTHLAQKLLMNVQCKGSSSFAKETLMMMSRVVGHQKSTVTNWEPSSKLILLKLHENLSKDSTLTILQSFCTWSKLERWRSLISGCLMSWLQIKKKKNHYFEVSSSFILHNSKPFLNQIVTCDKKWILYDNQRLPT